MEASCVCGPMERACPWLVQKASARTGPKDREAVEDLYGAACCSEAFGRVSGESGATRQRTTCGVCAPCSCRPSFERCRLACVYF